VNSFEQFAKTRLMEKKISEVKNTGACNKAKKIIVTGVALTGVAAFIIGGAILPQGKNAEGTSKGIKGIAVQGAVMDAMFNEEMGFEPLAVDVGYMISQIEDINGLGITSKAAFLMEANSGKVLYHKDSDKKLPIASMVKITTLAVIYDALEAGEITLDQMVTVSENSSGMGGSQAFLDTNNEYSVDDLIKSIIIASANDSCVAMAELVAGSETEFVARMNALSQRLGMKNTNYANVTGLPAVGAYSTAEDVAKVYAYMMQSKYYGTHEKTWMYDLQHPSGRVTGLTNTNRHARFYNGITGGKTGFTSEAGHCITVSATRGDLRPVAVIIGSQDSKTRFSESGRLMDHVFGAYQNKLVVSKDDVLATVKVKGAMKDKVDLFARTDFYDLVKKGDKNQSEIKIEVNKTINAPFTTNDSVGKIFITRAGKVEAEIDLVSNTNIKKLGYFGSIKKIVSKYKVKS